MLVNKKPPKVQYCNSTVKKLEKHIIINLYERQSKIAVNLSSDPEMVY